MKPPRGQKMRGKYPGDHLKNNERPGRVGKPSTCQKKFRGSFQNPHFNSKYQILVLGEKFFELYAMYRLP